ncbi:crotonyl-CoA carboxylase/reductase [bacterium]|nr:crotonyl-CoA carboxylase/reductase [bacterium]
MWAYGVTKDKTQEIMKIDLGERLPSMGIIRMNVPTPSLRDDEVLIKPRASALNYNTLWSGINHPATPFQLISGHVKRNQCASDHLQDFAIFGSDCAGEIVEVGGQDKEWTVGDEIVVHCNVVNVNEYDIQNDAMLAKSQSIWGYETNYGAFAEYTKVKKSQLLRKPSHLSFEETAGFSLTLSTAYRMLISPNGARISAGDKVLIWGAAGGLGTFAIQLCKLAGAKSIAIVSGPEKAEVCRSLGADFVIDRSVSKFGPFLNEGNFDLIAWSKAKRYLASIGVPEIDVVFEHIGADTLGFSTYVLRRGGRVVICAASSGFNAQIDLRYLWMELKSIIGSHFANYREAFDAAQLVFDGKIKTEVFETVPIEKLPQMADAMWQRETYGKIVFTHP